MPNKNVALTYIAVALASFQVGCVITAAPKYDRGYAKTSTLKNFEGCYQNQSETRIEANLIVQQNTPSPVYLTDIIWPEEFKMTRPEAVLVKAISENTLEVSTFGGGVHQKTSLFVKGKDFWLKSGHLKLRSQSHYGFADVFFGIYHKSTTLGVDANGNGRSVKTEAFAGTGFLIMPIAGLGSDTGGFKRNPTLCGGN